MKVTDMHAKIFANAVSGLALAVAMGSAAVPQAAFAQAAPAASEDDGAPIITVTARKREESLLETPIAISALSTQEIEQRGIVSLTDLVDATPGVNVTSNNSGRNDRSFQQISMRGFTPSTTDSTLVASFIDGVPVSSSSALNSITDPARVEVLKGSQNAYFGRNAFAGAINVVNKMPGRDLGGAMSASVYSRGGYDITGSLEGQIAPDVLGVRITGRAMQKGGSYINGANANERLGDQQTRSVSGLVVFTPLPQLTIKAFGIYSKDKDGASAQGMISAYEVKNAAGAVVVPGRSNCTLNGFTAGRVATEARVLNSFICGAAPDLLPGYGPAQNTTVSPAIAAALASGAYRPVSPQDGVQGYGLKRRYEHLHFNIDYELGGGFTFSSLTGFNDEYYSEMAELDNYDSSTLPTVPPAVAPTAANGLLPYYNFPFAIERVNRDFSQELRVAFDNKGPLTAMLGVNYLWSKTYRDLFNVQSEGVTGTVLTANRSAATMSSPQQVRTWGAFGTVSYDVTDKFTVNLEGRFQRDKVYLFGGGTGANVSPAAATALGIPAGAKPAMTAYYAKSFDNFMPRVILNYKFSPDVMAYASWSKAANISIASFNARLFSGTLGEQAELARLGVQAVTEPEKLTTFEIGVKGKAFDNKLIFALAAYASEWKNQYNSRSSFFLDTSLPTPANSTVTGLANSGRSLLKGVEADITAYPVEGVSLAFSGAITDTNVRTFTDPSISRITGLIGNDFVGKKLPLTSQYSFSFSPAFTGNIPGRDDATWLIRADVNYKSKQFLDPGNLTWIKGRTVVNARVGVTLDQFSLEVFATNLLNNKAYTSIQQNTVQVPAGTYAAGPFSYLIVGLPELRTVGIKGSVKF